MGKNNWDNKTKATGFIKCGTKEYDKTKIQNCSRELVVRAYLEKRNASQYVTKLEKIEPQELYDYIKTIPADRIQNDFFSVCEDLENYMKTIKFPVRLTIEKGREINCNTAEAENMVSEIISALKALHSIGVIHLDIKLQNLLLIERVGAETIVLNDFDTSIILPDGVKSISINKPNQMLGLTPRFAAPEQYKINYGKCAELGTAADIFSWAVIAYTLLNDNKHPYAENLNNMNGHGVMKEIWEIFQQKEKKGTQPFEPCRNGSPSLKNIISRALSINPDDRPSDDDILEALSDKNNIEPNTEPEKEVISTEIPETMPEKEEKTVDEQKHEKKSISENEKSIIIDGDNNRFDYASPAIVILALVIVAGIIILAMVKGNGDININNKNSISAEYNISSEPEVLTNTTILTNLTTTDTTSAFSSAESVETEKKRILLQL